MPSSKLSVFNPPAELSHTSAPVLVCFSHLRWNFVHQRPQHLLTRAAVTHQVYFVEEPVFERTGALPRLDLRTHSSGVVVAIPVLAEGSSATDVIDAQRMMLDDLLTVHASAEILFWYYTPMALEFSDHVVPDLCLYDCMDELSGFRGAPPELRSLERKLFKRSHLVFTGGQSLFEAKRKRHPNVYLFPSSIDRNHFVKARDAIGKPQPSDQSSLRRPRIGFFGVIDERMDVALVDRLAAIRPDWEFILLGPVVKIDSHVLPRRPNVHWLGAKDYSELPSYLATWDAGFMPFALNEATRFISPTKTPEFLAAGVPVVSTPIQDVVRPYGKLGLVEIASEPDEMATSIAALLSREKRPWLAKVDHYLADFSWDKTWAMMSAVIEKYTERRVSTSTGPAPLASPDASERATRV